MVHGRCAFECPKGESRHLQGACVALLKPVFSFAIAAGAARMPDVFCQIHQRGRLPQPACRGGEQARGGVRAGQGHCMGALQYHALTLIIRSPRAIAGFQCGSCGASWRRVKDCCCSWRRVKDCCCSVWLRAHLRCQVLEHFARCASGASRVRALFKGTK